MPLGKHIWSQALLQLGHRQLAEGQVPRCVTVLNYRRKQKTNIKNNNPDRFLSKPRNTKYEHWRRNVSITFVTFFADSGPLSHRPLNWTHWQLNLLMVTRRDEKGSHIYPFRISLFPHPATVDSTCSNAFRHAHRIYWGFWYSLYEWTITRVQ